MLKRLSISNFALIDEIDLQLNQGFSTITGETGAGKSIILGALGLVLGNRSDSKTLFNKERKCIVEAVFELPESQVQAFFTANDFDLEIPLIVRREISPAGKSRAFINDTPANLNQLSELGELLIDVHSQHETLALRDHGFRQFILNAFGGCNKVADEYTGFYKSLQTKMQELDQLREQEKNAKLDLDYNTFLFEELSSANLVDGELADKSEQLKQLEHAGEIIASLDKTLGLLEHDRGGVMSDLGEALDSVGEIAEFSKDIESLRERIHSVRIELDDVRNELENVRSGVDVDEEKLSEFRERVDELNHLFFKHQAESEQELIEKMDDLNRRISEVNDAGGRIREIENDILELEKAVDDKRKQLQKQQLKAGGDLSELIAGMLRELGIPQASFQVEVSLPEQRTALGTDVRFLFSANKGSAPGPMEKSASGGELSRIMLALKSTVSARTSLPTVIFDEIDSGVSGEVANMMARLMKKMSAHMQVISITHLPQIAAKGHTHYSVYKSHEGETTTTHIRELGKEDRILELAKMLSGDQVTGVSKENARTLLDN
jgi:DNA repair protein RecN (Recombination protein N)